MTIEATFLRSDTEPTNLMIAAVKWARDALIGTGVTDSRARLDSLLPDSPLDLMSMRFGLSPADEDCLLFCLAHRVDGGLALLCAEAAGDPRQGYVTAHLLTRTLGEDAPDFAVALFGRLMPDAPLRRWALVDMAETHALAAITLNEGVVRRLASGTGVPPVHCTPLIAAPPLPRLVDGARTIAPRLGEGVALIGPRGSGRRALAAAAAPGAVMLDRTTLPAGGARRQRLREIARDAALDGHVVVVEADPDEGISALPAAEESSARAAAGAEGRALAREVAEVFGGNLIVLANDPTGLSSGLFRHRTAPLDAREREAIWAAALPPGPCRAEAQDVARQFPLGPSEIAEIAAGIQRNDPPGTLWQCCRGRGGRGLESLATRIVPRRGWNELILPPAILEDLHAIADQLRHRATVYDEWGFAHRLSTGRGVTALFAGPSGVGKTMAAEVIAGDLGLDLYKVDLSRLVSKYIGETEKNLRRVFDAAEETGACLFLDEADACLGKRSEVKDSHDRHANIEVSYLLQRMESYSGLCLLATNLKNNLDTAFLRRLRFVVDIPFPDQGDRFRIWQGAFPQGTPTEGLNLAALARMDITGGSIMVIAVNAAFLAAAEGGPVTMDRIARAARGEFRKHDRSFRREW